MKTKKVILNKCYGGFGLSEDAFRLYAKKKGIELYLYEERYLNNYKTQKWYKLENEKGCFISHYFTKDFGDDVEISRDDIKKYYFNINTEHREDLTLIEVVEELGDKANDKYSKLEIVEIPADMEYVIDDYDGIETLHKNVQEW